MLISTENTDTKLDTHEQKNIHYELLGKLKHSLETEQRFLDPNLTICILAKELHTNREYLSRTINQYFGKSYTDYINEYRINTAINLLENIANKITKPNTMLEIANASGFKSTSTFNPAFKKVAGVTPSEYIQGIKRL